MAILKTSSGITHAQTHATSPSPAGEKPSSSGSKTQEGEPPKAAGWAPKAHVATTKSTQGTNPYGIAHLPKEQDWNFEASVREFQKPENIPPQQRSAMAEVTSADLRRGVSQTWPQDVTLDGKREAMTVELTRKLVPIPYETFISKLPPAQWGGSNLARYLGGEVRPVAFDAQGRPTKQIERMVLAQDDLTQKLSSGMQRLGGAFANDMTKVETITYGENRSRVDWRVYSSHNGSTLADVGSVTFEKSGGGTLVTFHSAHQLGVPGTALIGLPALEIPSAVVRKPLGGAFLAHANHYEQVLNRSP